MIARLSAGAVIDAEISIAINSDGQAMISGAV